MRRWALRASLSLVLCFVVVGNVGISGAAAALGTQEQGAVKIAVVQFQPQKDKAENLGRLERYLEQAGAGGANLVVLPELCTTYYPWSSLTWSSFSGEALAYYHENAEPVPGGPTTSLMSALATRYRMYISWGMAEKDGRTGELYSSQVLVGPDGAVVGVYRKIHLVPGLEDAIFAPGDQTPLFDTTIGKIAIMICYDRRFPELARTYALLGAEVLLVPAATTDRFVDEFILATRAYENCVWLVFANQVGPQPGGFPGVMHGDSRIIDPHGNTLSRASGQQEEILWGTIVPRQGKEEGLLQRRRAAVYAEVPVMYPATKDEMINIVVQNVLHDSTDGKKIYLTHGPLPAGTVVQNWTQDVRTLPAAEWMAFIDDSPDANWEHPCRYVFVDDVTRACVIVDATSPPRILSNMEEVRPCPSG